MTSEVTGMGNHIYTIGRELGSGGYTVAKLLAGAILHPKNDNKITFFENRYV